MGCRAGYVELLRADPESAAALQALLAAGSTPGARVAPWLLAEGTPACHP